MNLKQIVKELRSKKPILKRDLREEMAQTVERVEAQLEGKTQTKFVTQIPSADLAKPGPVSDAVQKAAAASYDPKKPGII